MPDNMSDLTKVISMNFRNSVYTALAFVFMFSAGLESQTCIAPVNDIVYVLPVDGIPAISNPEVVLSIDELYEGSEDQPSLFRGSDRVIGVYINGHARAYPIKVFWWHEIINDNLGGESISVTYCPLTGTGITFNRRIDGRPREFLVSGLLLNNNLVILDSSNNTLYPQMCPKAVSGADNGNHLEYIASIETTWDFWKQLHPNTSVVSFNTGHSRDYNLYPYGTWEIDHDRLLYDLSYDDPRLNRKDYVVTVFDGTRSKAYPFEILKTNTVVNDRVGDEDILIIYDTNSFTPLVYDRLTSAGALTFKEKEETTPPRAYVDEQTGSTWNLLGEAIEGPLMGEQLEQVKHAYSGFWFGFGAFFQTLKIYEPDIVSDTTGGEYETLPESFELDQNYPNPFNAGTSISFSLPASADVNLVIYDLLGKEIRRLVSRRMQPGRFVMNWDGRDSRNRPVSTGVYIYRLTAGSFIETRKMVYLK